MPTIPSVMCDVDENCNCPKQTLCIHAIQLHQCFIVNLSFMMNFGGVPFLFNWLIWMKCQSACSIFHRSTVCSHTLCKQFRLTNRLVMRWENGMNEKKNFKVIDQLDSCDSLYLSIFQARAIFSSCKSANLHNLFQIKCE